MDDLDTMIDAVALARDILASEADPVVLETANRLYKNGEAAWALDPNKVGVIGLVKPDSRYDAYIVVYLSDNDFECSAEFDSMMEV